MTKEEFMFAKHITWQNTFIQLQVNVWTPVLPKNNRRVSLCIPGMLGNIFFSVSDRPRNTIGQGLAFPTNGNPQQFFWRDWGDLLQREIWCVADTLLFYTFWEGTLDCKCEMSEIWKE